MQSYWSFITYLPDLTYGFFRPRIHYEVNDISKQVTAWLTNIREKEDSKLMEIIKEWLLSKR